MSVSWNAGLTDLSEKFDQCRSTNFNSACLKIIPVLVKIVVCLQRHNEEGESEIARDSVSLNGRVRVKHRALRGLLHDVSDRRCQGPFTLHAGTRESKRSSVNGR